MFKNKKGQEIVAENFIFLTLNLIVFVMLLVFISNGSNGKYVQEQYYAKQIASMINEASPGMTLDIYMGDLFTKYKKEFDSKKMDKDNILKIDSENGTVYFSLNSQTYYSYKFFNNVIVLPGDDGKFVHDNYIILNIKEKE